MAEIKWTTEAEYWLKDIHGYISQDDPIAAKKIVEGIYDKVQYLKQFPEIGYKYEQKPEQDIRILLYGHYRIAYLIKADGNIDILGVFHGSIEIERYLT